jgi:hypothetical protein
VVVRDAAGCVVAQCGDEKGADQQASLYYTIYYHSWEWCEGITINFMLRLDNKVAKVDRVRL